MYFMRTYFTEPTNLRFLLLLRGFHFACFVLCIRMTRYGKYSGFISQDVLARFVSHHFRVLPYISSQRNTLFCIKLCIHSNLRAVQVMLGYNMKMTQNMEVIISCHVWISDSVSWYIMHDAAFQRFRAPTNIAEHMLLTTLKRYKSCLIVFATLLTMLKRFERCVIISPNITSNVQPCACS